MLLTDASHPTPHPSRVARHLVSLRLGHARALTPHCGVIHSPRAAMLPQGEGFLFCKWLLLCKSQRLEPLAGSIGLLALVHTTRLTGGYDFMIWFYYLGFF